MTTEPIYPFNAKWDTLSEEQKAAFAEKCKEIEEKAIKELARTEKVKASYLRKIINPLDPEEEWGSTVDRLPDDCTWIDYELQFFREALAEKRWEKKRTAEKSNKKNGTNFEQEFKVLAGENGFWATMLNADQNGQPADIIMAKNGMAALIDCKDCKKGVFTLDRIEENQEYAMIKWLDAGNKYAGFALKTGEDIRIIDFPLLMILRDTGQKQLNKSQIFRYGKTFETWTEDFNESSDQ